MRPYATMVLCAAALLLVGASGCDEGGDGGCRDAADCVGQVPNLGPCEQEDCQANACVAVLRDDGDTCDDGDACTDTDMCTGGVCGGTFVCQCDPALDIQDDGSTADQTLPELVISEISPGSYIEFFNTTGSDIDLGATTFSVCSPFIYWNLSLQEAGVVIPAGGYAAINWPGGFSDTADGGEVILFGAGDFNRNANIMDFVCWGTNPHSSRLTQAETIGKWSGPCAPGPLTNGSIHRLTSTTGINAADYDTSAAGSRMDCTP